MIVLIRTDIYLFLDVSARREEGDLGRKCMYQEAPDAIEPEANLPQTLQDVIEIHRCNYLKFLKELMLQ